MTRYRIEVVQTRRGMLDIEMEPDESCDDLRQRAREVVEDGDAEPNWFDIEYATERCYDADAECQPRKGEPVPWCAIHDECMTYSVAVPHHRSITPREGVERCWRRLDDISEAEAPKNGWWKR